MDQSYEGTTGANGHPGNGLGLFNSYMIVLIVMEYAIPLTVISYAYLRMGVKLWLTRTPGKQQSQMIAHQGPNH